MQQTCGLFRHCCSWCTMGRVQSPLLNGAEQPHHKQAAGMGTSRFLCQCVSAANRLLKRKRNSLAVGKMYVEGRRAYKSSLT